MYRLTQQTVNTYVFAYISTTNGVIFMTLVPKYLPRNNGHFSKSFKLNEKELRKTKKNNIFPRAEITENSAKANLTNLAEKTLLPISG